MIPSAIVCDLIKAVDRGDYQDSKIFIVEGESGFYRRISRDGRSGATTPVDNAIVAHFQDKLIELKHWGDMESYVKDKSKSSAPRTAGEAPNQDSVPSPIPPYPITITPPPPTDGLPPVTCDTPTQPKVIM